MYSYSSVLTLVPEAYARMVEREPAGLFLNINMFHVAVNSMPTSLVSQPFGTVVFQGAVHDIEFLPEGNTVVFTLIVPAAVQNCFIDSIGLWNTEGMVAQGFIERREKLQGTDLLLYAYINAPEPSDLVEFRPLVPSPTACVSDYADLDRPSMSKGLEAVVLNGHGSNNRANLPEFLPTMVVLSSTGSPVFPPLEPFSDPDLGTLSVGSYRYSVTVLTALGETLPSPPHDIDTVQLNPPAEVFATLGPGGTATGTHYYQIVAVQSGGATTLGSTEVSLSTVKLLSPVIQTLVPGAGKLEAGTYAWVITARSAFGETLPSAIETLTVIPDSSVVLTWTAVVGAIGYTVYRRMPGGTLFVSVAQVTSTAYTDWGAEGTNRPAPTVATDSGPMLTWSKVDDADFYQIYGRVSGSLKRLLVQVDSSTFTWVDDGRVIPPGAPLLPSVNTTGSGLKLKWDAVEGATGYRIYGRTRSAPLGLLGTTTNTFFIDDGSIVPTTAEPTENTTAPLEWQPLEGQLLFEGTPQSIQADVGFTIVTTFAQRHDFAMMHVLTGPLNGLSRHIRLQGNGEFLYLDKPLAGLTTTNTIRIWGAPSQCGGVCRKLPVGDPLIFDDPVVIGPPPVVEPTPDLWYLGVHFCGRFIGLLDEQLLNRNNVNFSWLSSFDQRVHNGILEFAFCDQTGVTSLVPINNRIRTPFGNRLPFGDYASLQDAAPDAHLFTLDSIIIPPGLRLIVWSERNFSGQIIYDAIGPVYISNTVWLRDPRFNWNLDDQVWQGSNQLLRFYPRSKRTTTAGLLIPDMRRWVLGSVQIVRELGE